MATFQLIVQSNLKEAAGAGGEVGIRVAQIAMSNSYAAGGEAMVPSDLLLHGIEICVFDQDAGYLAVYDDANRKIKVFRQKDPAAVGGADVPLPEVAAGVDLSALQFKAFVVGRP